MGHQGRQTIIAGNWKMYKTIKESVDYVRKLTPLVKNSQRLVYLAVPFTALSATAHEAQGTNLVIGAQNMNDAEEGAFTGEISGRMLKEAGAKFVVLGHSERRRLYHEGNDWINRKLARAFQDGLQPILCIGEALQMREQGVTEFVLQTQLSQCLHSLTPEQVARTIIAYEPVWAIGTNKHATPQVAEETQKFCRHFIADVWGEAIADLVPILYGGSVKPENAKHLLEQPDIDGVLVGGASLSAETFSQIVNY